MTCQSSGLAPISIIGLGLRAVSSLRRAPQLGLPGLEVHPAQYPAARARVVVLHELVGHTQLGVAVAAVGLLKEPAFVAVHDRLDQDRALQLRLERLHREAAQPTWRDR